MLLYACIDETPPATVAECVEWALVEPPSLVPPLSIEDGATLLAAVCVLLATAWVFKQARRAM